MRRALIAVAIGLACLGGGRPALAQKSAAENLYDEAWTAMDRGDYDTACSKFEASYNVSHATGPLQGMARCEEGRKHPVRALEHWRDLEQRLPDSSPTKAEAKANIARLESVVGRLTLGLAPGAPPDTRVELDGAAVAADGKERLVDPNVPHRVRTVAAGHPDRIDDVIVPSGGSKRLDVAPGSNAAAPVELPRKEDDRSGLRTAGFVVGGIGVAGAIVFGITGGMMLAADSDVDDACGGDLDNCADGDAALGPSNRGNDLIVPNAIAFVGAVVGIGAGVTLLVISSRGDPTSSPTEVQASVVPGGLSLRGRF